MRIEQTQEALLAHLRGSLAFTVHEQAVPDAKTVLRDKTGRIQPYYAIQLGDLQQGRGRSMIGPRGDDYGMPFYVQCIDSDASGSRMLYNRLLDAVLGATFPWAGNVRKRPGGAMFTMTNSDGATECYTFPASFSLLVQFE